MKRTSVIVRGKEFSETSSSISFETSAQYNERTNKNGALVLFAGLIVIVALAIFILANLPA